MTNLSGTILGTYSIHEMIGRGGMANVYRAEQMSIGRQVAIKVLPTHFLQDPMFLQRFVREVKVIASLQHPHILPVHDFGEQDGVPYIVMAYLTGGSLADLIETTGGLPLPDVVQYVQQIADGLDYAHQKGIIHRDFKPSNVLLDERGNAYLADFGIAKITEATAQLTGSGIVGTPAYMAPEMAQPGGVTPLVDVYALGVTLYQMLSGHHPYEADTPMGILMAHLSQPIPDVRQERQDLPGAVQTVIERAMAKSPLDRYQTPGELAQDLTDAASHQPTIAAPPHRESVEATLVEETVVESPEAMTEPQPRPARLEPPAIGSAPRAKRQGKSILPWIGAAVGIIGLIIAGALLILSGLLGGSMALNTESTERSTLEPTNVAIEPPVAAASTEAPPTGNDCLDFGLPAAACNGEYAGTVVTMTGPFTDQDEIKFSESIKDFEDWTGIDIQYSGTTDFEAAINDAVQGGSAPDIADFAQPDLLRGLVQDGHIVDVSTFLDSAWLEKNYNSGWRDMAQMPGPDGNFITAGIWARYSGKSQVWYPKQAFEAAGYTIPTTWHEMLALSDQIVANGDSPWCVGIESDWATGWPATDWIEEIMLRTTSLENYDRWSFPASDSDRLRFTSPEVRHAAAVLGELWFKPGYVYGGSTAIANTSFADAPLPMFDNPPRCWLHKQGNWIINFFPEGLRPGVDYDWFYLPPIDPQYGNPYLIAGDIYAMFHDRPEVRAAMVFFSHGESLHAWLASGGALSPHNDTDFSWYGDDIERRIAEQVSQSSSVRFDGSDIMPDPVGAGTFWKGMTDWISGRVNLDTALQDIDASWPSQ